MPQPHKPLKRLDLNFNKNPFKEKNFEWIFLVENINLKLIKPSMKWEVANRRFGGRVKFNKFFIESFISKKIIPDCRSNFLTPSLS